MLVVALAGRIRNFHDGEPYCGWCDSWYDLALLPVTRRYIGTPCPPGLATNSTIFCLLLIKYHWFAWRENQWLLIREDFILFHFSKLLLSFFSDYWRPIWADTAPFKGPQLASCVAQCVKFFEMKNCCQPQIWGCHESGLWALPKPLLGIMISLDNPNPQ